MVWEITHRVVGSLRGYAGKSSGENQPAAGARIIGLKWGANTPITSDTPLRAFHVLVLRQYPPDWSSLSVTAITGRGVIA